MKRLVVLFGFTAGLVAGCGDEVTVTHKPDMKMSVDFAMTVIPIGGQCTLSTDCTVGTNPSCRKNKNTRTGMCSADCQIDADCGDGNVCLFAPTPPDTTPGACAKSCQMDTDCTEGLGCWISLDKVACWPLNGIAEFGKSLVLNCDPTVAGCTFAGSGLPGGCSRQVLGAGMAGVCRQGCDIGVGTCPDVSTYVQNCYFVDETLDTMMMPTGDKLKQPICVIDVPVGTPAAFIADGAECLDPATSNHYYDICLPGSQCESVFTMAGVTADNKCHKLCYLGSFTPPDMGALFKDGGIDGACPGGTTCTDVFGTTGIAAPGMPVGLCK
jgi:hypothetical protein